MSLRFVQRQLQKGSQQQKSKVPFLISLPSLASFLSPPFFLFTWYGMTDRRWEMQLRRASFYRWMIATATDSDRQRQSEQRKQRVSFVVFSIVLLLVIAVSFSKRKTTKPTINSTIELFHPTFESACIWYQGHLSVSVNLSMSSFARLYSTHLSGVNVVGCCWCCLISWVVTVVFFVVVFCRYFWLFSFVFSSFWW